MRKPPEESCRRWLHESVVLVKQSAEPEEDFLASTREMIAANRSLRGLLACYLADHHRAIVAAPLACRRRRGRHWLSFPLSQSVPELQCQFVWAAREKKTFRVDRYYSAKIIICLESRGGS
jgi:uncharacterized protein (TIGR01568 family)